MNSAQRASLARFVRQHQAAAVPKAPKVPKVKGLREGSALEIEFERMLLAHGIEGHVREYRFAPPRKWLFDFAWIESRFAVEIDGGVFARTRNGHTSATGIRRDYERDAAALALGWVVFRITAEMIPRMDTITIVKRWTAGAARPAMVMQSVLNI